MTSELLRLTDKLDSSRHLVRALMMAAESLSRDDGAALATVLDLLKDGLDEIAEGLATLRGAE